MQNDLFLVDTSAWLLALKKDFISEVKDRIDHLLKEDMIITTGIIRLEVLARTKTEREFQRLKSRLDALGNIETDNSLWQKACEVGFRLHRKGIAVPHTDILIAACAMKTESTILHADAHFDMMAKYAKLKVESFIKAVNQRLLPLAMI